MTRHRTNPNVTLSMNCGAVFRPSLVTGRFIQTAQNKPERRCNQEPWDKPAPPPPSPVAAQAAALPVLDIDL